MYKQLVATRSFACLVLEYEVSIQQFIQYKLKTRQSSKISNFFNKNKSVFLTFVNFSAFLYLLLSYPEYVFTKLPLSQPYGAIE